MSKTPSATGPPGEGRGAAGMGHAGPLPDLWRVGQRGVGKGTFVTSGLWQPDIPLMMTWIMRLIQICSWVALAICGLSAAFWIVLVFVIPDPACFKWGAVDYAAILIGLYWLLLAVSAFTRLNKPRLSAIVLAFALLGIWSSLLIYKLPQTRVECDGTVWPAGTA